MARADVDRADEGRAALRAVGAAGVLAVVGVMFGRAFVGSTGTGMVQPLDDAVRTWARADLLWFGGTARLLATVGATIGLLVAAVAISVLLWTRTGNLARSLLPALAVVMADVAGAVTKVAVGRPRPTSEGIGFLEYQSFPSGHMISAAALVGALVLVARSGRPGRVRVIVSTGITAVVLVVVAAGRIEIDAHWFTDVVAGIVMGLAAASTAWWALDPIRLRTRPVGPDEEGRELERGERPPPDSIRTVGAVDVGIVERGEETTNKCGSPAGRVRLPTGGRPWVR
jgi:membrane-associated phospholipid phosphatase